MIDYEALEESETRYRTLFDQTPLGVFTFDRQLRVTDCNPAFVRLLRSSFDKLLGLDLRVLGDAAVLPAVEKVLEGEPLYAEGPYHSMTGGARLYLAVRLTPLRGGGGEVIGGMGIFEDVTDRRAAEQALQRSEARFRTLIENAPDAIGVYRDGRHLYANAALARTMGFASPEEIARVAVVDLIHPDDRPTFHERNRLRAEGARLAAQEYRLVRRDGRVVAAEITSMTIDYDGAPAVLVVIRDVTERKQLQLQLLQADRMASVGMLAAGIAHEINNPLSYVMTNLEVIDAYKLPELRARARDADEALALAQLGDMIAAARTGAERVRSIVRDVKMFSRAASEDADTTAIDVRKVLDAALHMVDGEMRHRTRLVREYGDVPPVRANESRLGQVFLNLLVNAVQALPPKRAVAENEVTVRAYADADRVVVDVRDNGTGIAEEVLPRVFDPFFSTKPIGVGTGLGLFICQGIVTSLGGTIAAQSAPGKGTTFRVTLPASDARRAIASERPGAPTPTPAHTQARGGRVLVVDDEPSMGRAIAAALEGEHDVSFVSSAREALDLLARADDDAPFDVILCDLMMPDMTGMELFDAVARARASVAERFVFVTGGAFTPEARAFLDGPPARRERLDKPFDVSRLRALVRERVGARATARAARP